MATEIPELVGYFQRQNLLRRYQKGEIICGQGDPFEHVYMINSGMVKMYDLDSEGTERTIAIYAGNNVFPMVWLLRSAPKLHFYFYEAYTDVSCFVARADEVRRFAERQPVVLSSILDALTRAYINLAGRVTNLERSHIQERLEYVLYILALQLGSFEGTVAEVDTLITQEDLSGLAGVTRESVSLEMSHSNIKRSMWKDGRRTYIDIAKLDIDSMPTTFGGG